MTSQAEDPNLTSCERCPLAAMYHTYFQVRQLAKAIISSKQSAVVKSECVNYVAKRWAGHSKWQNIKSTKEQADQDRSKRFSRLSRLITQAAKKGDDISQNAELRNLVEEAKKNNMPKATLQKAIAAAKTQSGKPYWAVFSGPNGLVVGFEVTFESSNPNFLRSKLSSTKKLNLKMEVHHENVCSEKGIIVADLSENPEKSYEKAVEDAIEIGVSEVYETEDRTLVFECFPDRVDSLCQQLSKKGYSIQSASTELEFNNTVALSESDIKEVEDLICRLQSQNEEVIRATYNVSQQ